jgi:hypothetical protein
MLELTELCQDLVRDLRQELGYFRVSAYKHESMTIIEDKMTQLKSMVLIFGDSTLNEAFCDDFGLAANEDFQPLPGECRLSTRAGILINTVELGLKRLWLKLTTDHPSQPDEKLSETLRARKTELLSLCPEGTRQHLLFQAI